MSELQAMTYDNWIGMFMLLIMICMIMSLYKNYRNFMMECDWLGVKVIRWAVTISAVVFVIAMIVDAVGYAVRTFGGA